MFYVLLDSITTTVVKLGGIEALLNIAQIDDQDLALNSVVAIANCALECRSEGKVLVLD